ncbi:MAG: S9 family peptidase, partial [Candidatus Eremiobacteraeota bacterium]|nr:S9 family peptidase [Candidatus Eremiobacteraeota bacterium]
MLKRIAIPIVAVLAVITLTVGGLAFTYPSAPRGTVIDTYFGTKVADPYRWLEEIDSPQTQAWVSAEGNLTRSYLDAIPQRATIKKRLTELINYERFGLPAHEGPYYFYSHNSGLQNQ